MCMKRDRYRDRPALIMDDRVAAPTGQSRDRVTKGISHVTYRAPVGFPSVTNLSTPSISRHK
jgi:hypothetical protein